MAQVSGRYGYNMIYIGSRIWIDGYEDQNCKVTTKDADIRRLAQTLMFADTAMAKPGFYIEYSFAEPRYFVINGVPVTDSRWNPSPSIHFWHRGRANISWIDSHVSSEKIGKYVKSEKIPYNWSTIQRPNKGRSIKEDWC